MSGSIRKFITASVPLLWMLMTACSGGGGNSPPPQIIPQDDNDPEVQAALASTQAALQECEQQAAQNQGMILSVATALSQPGATVTGGTLPGALPGVSGFTPTAGTSTSGSCQQDMTTAILTLLSAHANSGQLAINTAGFIPYLQSLFGNMISQAGTGLAPAQQAQLAAAGWQLFQQILPSLPAGAQSQLSAYVPGASGLPTALGATAATLPAGVTLSPEPLWSTEFWSRRFPTAGPPPETCQRLTIRAAWFTPVTIMRRVIPTGIRRCRRQPALRAPPSSRYGA